ncbi:MAG: M23 family metallopeptidase [Deltaproteobacteria bacterium]|nr:M23 family metallopeptidase [Deltaproteobacteria bacterium]
MSKRFTVMIIPEDGKRVRHLRIRRSLLTSALVGLLLFVGLFAWLAYSQLDLRFKQSELQHLRLVNGRQRLNLQRLNADVDGMSGELARLAETEARVRQLADFDSSPQAVPVAVGGIPDGDNPSLVDAVQKRINQLRLAIDLRRQSQEDVRNLLNDQVSISRATPKGWPARGWITSYFGMRRIPGGTKWRIHEGLDIAANIGTPVMATADGVVARAEYSSSYGKAVIIDHGYGYRTLYGHNSRILVKRGERIRRGEKIAEVGNTGRSTGPHVHYEVRLNGIPIDPRKSL